MSQRAGTAAVDLTGPQPDQLQGFLAAVRDGDFESLLAVLDPNIVLRADRGALGSLSRFVRGAEAVAQQAATFWRLGLVNQIVLVNGSIGIVARRADSRPFSVLGFSIAGGKIVQINILADPDRLNGLDLSALGR